MRAWRLTALVAAPLIGLGMTSCGGGEAREPASPGVEAAEEADPAVGGSGGEVTLGTPTVTADPGTAWAEVESTRIDYPSAGSLNYLCDIGPDRVQVNVQTPEGRDLLLRASLQGDRWLGQLTFAPGDGTVQYSASFPGDVRMVIGDGALSVEGTVTKVEDFDLANATEADATVAVSCGAPADSGEEATAVLDGTTYTFPASGAQSFDCTVAPESLDVRINRLAVDGLQLEISARVEGGSWIGAVVVNAPDATYTSTLTPEGTGLVVDGSTVGFEGTFTGGPAGDVTGTVSASCP